LTRLLPIPVW